MKHLRSLRIRGFRGFQDLTIPKLGHVNLITGKNSVGKSSLLEAIELYANNGNISVIGKILRNRNEFAVDTKLRASSLRDENYSFESLFIGRDPIERRTSIAIGEARSTRSIKMRLVNLFSLRSSEFRTPRFIEAARRESSTGRPVIPGLRIAVAQSRAKLVPLSSIRDALAYGGRIETAERMVKGECVFLDPHGMDWAEAARLWDSISLTEEESAIADALKIISPDIERLSFIQHPSNRENRVAYVKLRDAKRPVPFRSLGDGVSRLLGISLALLRARHGVLLIDEVESGIHYSIQPDVWRMIFTEAARHNIQVFAATHSWDCVTAFTKIAKEMKSIDGILVRLDRGSGEKIKVTPFSENELVVAARERIEVR